MSIGLPKMGEKGQSSSGEQDHVGDECGVGGRSEARERPTLCPPVGLHSLPGSSWVKYPPSQSSEATEKGMGQWASGVLSTWTWGEQGIGRAPSQPHPLGRP